VSASSAGLITNSAAWTVNDRGCLPIVGTAQTQTTTALQYQVALGATIASVTSAGVATDLAAYITQLCTTSGTCCYTNLCNSANLFGFGKINFVLLILSSLFVYLI
jgi:hypothetical protein